jgi:hypothetical protein
MPILPHRYSRQKPGKNLALTGTYGKVFSVSFLTPMGISAVQKNFLGGIEIAKIPVISLW